MHETPKWEWNSGTNKEKTHKIWSTQLAPIETKHKCLISAFACDSLAPLASYALRIDMELELQLLSGGNQRKR